MAGRKKAIVILSAAVLAVAVAVIVLLAVGKPHTPETVSREEFLLIYENEVRPQVLMLSQDPGGDWYTEPYEETTLGGYAQELTVKALKGYKARQQLFRSHGLWDFTYEAFLDQWQNQKDDGNPYGVQAYGLYDYYVYLHSAYSLQLMHSYDPDSAALKEYYEQHKDEFRDTDVWQLQIWQTGSQQDAQKTLEQAARNGSADGVTFTEVTLDADAAKYYPEILALVGDGLEQLKTPGQRIYREADGASFLIQSESFAEGRPIPYEECEEVVRSRCKQQMLDQAVAQALENINVQQQELPAVGK
ncbi:MAG: peptidyl-prolyl cis-trans isomerase [Oscillospiraceae bacterium]|nr:peptidyl-prolyl cis-trans isomerase [Oscillospiraceae bacterium]